MTVVPRGWAVITQPAHDHSLTHLRHTLYNWCISGRTLLGVIVSCAPRGCGAAGSAPRSQRGGQGFESPQLHWDNRRSKALFRSGDEGLCDVVGQAEQQKQRCSLAASRPGRPPRVAMAIMRSITIAGTWQTYTAPVRSHPDGAAPVWGPARDAAVLALAATPRCGGSRGQGGTPRRRLGRCKSRRSRAARAVASR
jgi:hypothetical protein